MLTTGPVFSPLITPHSGGLPIRVIEIVISPAGQTRIETRGYSGADCQKASEFLEKALGQRQDEELTPEYYQTTTTAQPLQEHS